MRPGFAGVGVVVVQSPSDEAGIAVRTHAGGQRDLGLG